MDAARDRSARVGILNGGADPVAARIDDLDAQALRRVDGPAGLQLMPFDVAQDLRFVRGDDLKALNARLGRIERRLASLEKAIKPKAPARKRSASFCVRPVR